MAKRKTTASSDDGEYNSNASGSGSEQEPISEKHSKSRQQKISKKDQHRSEESPAGQREETTKPLLKRPKKEKSSDSIVGGSSPSGGNAPEVLSTGEGDKYINLGKKKRATVRTFKGNTLLDIREYYGNAGEEKPGKKGISLTPEQWQVLRNGSAIIDDLFSKEKK